MLSTYAKRRIVLSLLAVCGLARTVAAQGAPPHRRLAGNRFTHNTRFLDAGARHCQAGAAHQTSHTARVAEHAVSQKIASLDYNLDGGVKWARVPAPGTARYPLTVHQGTIVNFRAAKADPHASWPNGQPVWSGRNWHGQVGETAWEEFDDVSLGSHDLKTVSAMCQDTLTARIKVIGPPSASPVALRVGHKVSDTAVPLSWTEDQDTEFERYQLYRSTSPVFKLDNNTLIAAFWDGETSYTDNAVKFQTTYYYKIVTLNWFGTGALSNRVAARTLAVPPPAAVILSLDPPASSTYANLRWTQSADPHFKRYELYRSLKPGFTPSAATLIQKFDFCTDVSIGQEGLHDDIYYYYKIVVVDDTGRSATSNEVLVNLPPPPVNVSAWVTPD